jgi:hypothetical protein
MRSQICFNIQISGCFDFPSSLYATNDAIAAASTVPRNAVNHGENLLQITADTIPDFLMGLPAAESVLSKMMLRAIGVGGLLGFRMEEVISSPLLADRWGNPVIFAVMRGWK